MFVVVVVMATTSTHLAWTFSKYHGS